MTWPKIRAISWILLSFTVTLNGTACVRSSSHNQPTVIEKQTLESVQIKKLDAKNVSSQKLVHSSSLPIKEMIKDYHFSVSAISIIQISAQSHSNSQCAKTGSFLYNFYFIDESGDESVFHPGRERKQLFPGDYTLRVKLENGEHCKNIAMNFDIYLKSLSDLTTLRPVEAKVICHTVESSNQLKNDVSLEILTQPLQVNHLRSKNAGQDIEISPIINDAVFCGSEIRSNHRCSESPQPVAKNKDALISIKKNCKKNRASARSNPAYLKIYGQPGNISGSFTCSTRGANRKTLRYNMTNCQALYVLGTNLETNDDARMTIKRYSTEVDFSINQKDLDQLPDQFYGNIVAIIDGQAESMTRSFLPLNKSQIQAGENSIKLTSSRFLFGLLRRKEIELSQLRFVISSRRQNRSGVFQLSFADLCEKNSRAISIDDGKKLKNLCLQ